ncbi:MAG: hypothetical protein ACR2H3_04915 [Acidimicrobiales bacterium]
MSRLEVQNGRRRLALFAAVAVVALLLSGTSGAPAAKAAVRPAPDRAGYWMVAADGGVFAFGSSGFHGSTGATPLTKPVVGMSASPSGQGYRLVASDGGVFSFGDAGFYGSTGAIALNAPIVGMAATPSGLGYWLVASDGGIFAFGDARFLGSTGSRRLDAPIVGMAANAAGDGYWLVGSDGGIFGFGSAGFFGSTGGRRLNRPVVGMAPTPSGNGYWLVASDGGIFGFGGAVFRGSTGGTPLSAAVVGMAASVDGAGYWLVAADGGIFSFGNVPFLGSAAPFRPSRPVVGIDARLARPATAAAFYYPWYGSDSVDGRWIHWNDHGHAPPDDIAANFYPARGAYSSIAGPIIEAHFAEMRAAGIATVVASWWGQSSHEDNVLPQLIDAANRHGMRLAIHIEPHAGRTPALLEYDLNYLTGLGIDEVWLYAIDGPPASEWRPVTDKFRGRVRFWAHGGLAGNYRNNAFLNYARAAGFDGIYTYYALGFDPATFASICAQARARDLLCSPSVSPGYDGRRGVPDAQVSGRESGARYDRWWTGALAATADVVSVTSYNEWHEGTQIEPATPKCITGFCYDSFEGAYGRAGADAGRAYLDLTAVWSARALSGW